MTPQQAKLHNRVMKSLSEDLGKIMAKEEIVQRTLNPLKNLWWRLPGVTITVPWPSGWTEQDDLGNQMQSADPNDHYRSWMEQNVGRQGWDWDWRISEVTEGFNGLIRSKDTLDIRFRRGREKYATLFTLRYTK